MTSTTRDANIGQYARAERIVARCREVAAYTEIPGQITRTFLAPPMHGVHQLLRRWMHTAGMDTAIDPAGNLRAVDRNPIGSAPRVLLGSHLDSVPNAGAFDGVLGVILAIAVAEELGPDIPVTTEIIGFSEEEGVRFAKPFFGSMAVTGSVDAIWLDRRDANGVTLAQAIRNFGLDPTRLPEAALQESYSAYLEVHIEQGPVLEKLSHSIDAGSHNGVLLGVADAIVGQSRLQVEFQGRANHAGTTPMRLRHDALAAAGEWIVAVEALALGTPGLVATIGTVSSEPGAANIVPGLVRASLDVRHADDDVRKKAVAAITARAHAIAKARGLRFSSQTVLDQPAVRMNPHLVEALSHAVVLAGHTPHRMASGAGHDAMILAPHIPSVMLFVPSPGGLSHHPDESVLAKDVEAALDTVLEFVRALSRDEMLRNA